ncbi:MAG: ABC transporter permease [Phaeodactylibacter sp.]|nr:ABC transporter permease [Phaeodactylibacter sp.]MCB9299992.1 ABC transporter permease [Lewinellaceae bacterium]
MKLFWLALRSEFLKSRRTLALATTAWLPAFIAGLIFALFYFKSEDFAKMGMDPWNIMASNVFGLYAVLILPMYAMVVAFSTNQVEHVANAWKNLFTLPYPRLAIYLSKWAFAFLLILAFSLILCGLIFMAGNALAILKPEIGFQDFDSFGLIARFFLKFFLGVMGVFSIQFLLSFYWRDFIRPVGAGLALTIAGAIGAGWDYAYLFPYAATVRINVQYQKEQLDLFPQEVVVSLLATLALFLIGYYFVLRRISR